MSLWCILRFIRIGLTASLHSYFIKEGTVSESGTHDELIARHGDYYEYVQLQALNK